MSVHNFSNRRSSDVLLICVSMLSALIVGGGTVLNAEFSLRNAEINRQKWVHPVEQIPNWGAMRSPAEWNRSFHEMLPEDFVPVPPYDLSVLTTPIESLIRPIRRRNIPLITAKLYYSVRHMGSYHIDAGEYSGTHPGVDLKLARGTPVGAIGDGRVHIVSRTKELGKFVIIEHRHGSELLFSVYGHLDDIRVQAGMDIQAVEHLGTVGMTGATSAPHLHLQLDRFNGTLPHVPFVPSGHLPQRQLMRFTLPPLS